MTTNVYIDGLNRIEYFTALVRPRSEGPGPRLRQQVYLRALRTLPELDIVLGRFLTSEIRMPVAGKVGEQRRFVRVVKTEEKGSDVNLASHMLRDGFRGNYDMAVLVTNDSDLLEPIRIVREELGLVVGILNPHKRASNVLRRQASFMKPIRSGVLRVSQFPTEIHDQQGVFRKPEGW